MLQREGELRVTFTSYLMQMIFLLNCPVLSTQLNLLFVKHPAVLGFFLGAFFLLFSVYNTSSTLYGS